MINSNIINLKKDVILLKNDYEGEVSAAVEYAVVPNSSAAVLYVHGYMDYFFQHHLVSYFVNQGISFYAIELRKYGSSIKSYQHENFIKDIKEYDEEMSIVLNKIKQDGHTKIILNGHSTGGLIATHYVLYGEYKNLISGVILNSPFLEFNVPNAVKTMLLLVAPLGRWLPYIKIAQLPSNYTQSLHQKYKGRWGFDLKYKPVLSFATYLGWARAILIAQKDIRKSLLSR